MSDQAPPADRPGPGAGVGHGNRLEKRPRNWKPSITIRMTSCQWMPVSGMCQCLHAHLSIVPHPPDPATVALQKEMPSATGLDQFPSHTQFPPQTPHPIFQCPNPFREADHLPELPRFRPPDLWPTRLRTRMPLASSGTLEQNHGHLLWQSFRRKLVC
jgi:hypothetical protein